MTALRSREEATLLAPPLRPKTFLLRRHRHIIPELAVFKAKLLSVFEVQWLTILPAPDTETLSHFADAVYLRVSYRLLVTYSYCFLAQLVGGMLTALSEVRTL